jgi:hypothetical protein
LRQRHCRQRGVAGNALGRHARLADVLHNHVRSLDLEETNGRAEANVYQELVAEHRAIADRLQALAETMRGHHGLPMASHDMAALMDQRAFAALVAREQELLALTKERVDEYNGMLQAMRQGA